MESLTEFRKAEKPDARQIADLVNSAYRGESSRLGWTTEADLLGGQRTDVDEVSALLEREDSLFILCLENGILRGSIHLEKSGEAVIFGMLAVSPLCQKRGLGKRLIMEAERTAAQCWKFDRFRMAVLTFREALVEFYERRGYRRTGRFEPFPDDPKFGIPKVPGLCFEWLEKPLGSP